MLYPRLTALVVALLVAPVILGVGSRAGGSDDVEQDTRLMHVTHNHDIFALEIIRESEFPSPPFPVSSGVKKIPLVEVVKRPWYTQMFDSHSTFITTRNPAAKMVSPSIDFWEEYPSVNTSSVLWLYTIGEPVTFLTPSNEDVPENIRFFGFRSTSSEVAAIEAIGKIVRTSPHKPLVVVEADGSREQIAALAELPFVYKIDLLPRGGLFMSASNIRYYEKIQEAKTHRNAWDGSGDGRMPNIVDFAVIDTGYDSSQTKFNSPYGYNNIELCHDWVDYQSCSNGDNLHGTLVADILDLANYHGGGFHIHRLAADGSGFADDIARAIEDIYLYHSDVDVVTLSAGLFPTDSTCLSYYDDEMEPLVLNRITLFSAAVGNEPDVTIPAYPASSTFAAAVGGIYDGYYYGWDAHSSSVYGTITLDNGCPIQRDFHDLRDDATSLFKPDVYGFWYHSVDKWPYVYQGTSFATPQIASGLGTIFSQYAVGKISSNPPWKVWTKPDPWWGCWSGAYKLVKGSAARWGDEVYPTTASQLGGLADHDAWFQDDYRCP